MVNDLEMIDLNEEKKKENDEFESSLIDLDAAKENEKNNEPSFKEKVGDFFVQAGRGALKAFTWPLDILKLGMMGEGLAGADELEELYFKAGKANEFDKNQYIRDVLETSEMIPTQDLLEKGIEKGTGYSLEPKSEIGKRSKQFFELVSFTKGGPLKKLASAGIGTATTTGLEALGVGEGKAQLAGDITSLGPQFLKKVPKQFSVAAQEADKIAQKHLLPFLEVMTREKAPFVQGKITQATNKNLKEKFKLSTQQALDKIVRDEIPIKNLQERGISLDVLGQHAYDVTRQLARNNNTPIKTDEIVANIDKEINRIKSLAPSPSEAQKAAIEILEKQRDIMKVSNPNAEHLVNQHINYNSDMNSIYRKPEFSGKENEVRKSYEFLKDQLVSAMDKQGHKSTANAFKASNKIYHEKSKLDQTQRILSKAFKNGEYSPKKLNQILNGRDGKFLKRNLSPKAINEIEEIAKYGEMAENKIAEFIQIQDPTVSSYISSLGQLAPLLLIPNKMIGAGIAIAKPIAEKVQGYLLTNSATRNIYKATMKHAAEGSFQLLKKDFILLEEAISDQYGDVDNFIDKMTEELEFLDLD